MLLKTAPTPRVSAPLWSAGNSWCYLSLPLPTQPISLLYPVPNARLMWVPMRAERQPKGTHEFSLALQLHLRENTQEPGVPTHRIWYRNHNLPSHEVHTWLWKRCNKPWDGINSGISPSLTGNVLSGLFMVLHEERSPPNIPGSI